MDERAALARIAEQVPAAGDDCAVVEDLVVTTDMLHESTDFPDGTEPYTAGWRAVGASLSDVAAMGAEPIGALAVYGAPEFDGSTLSAFVDGAVDVCELVGTEYVGGDLDGHDEFTVSSTAVGRTEEPVLRSGAEPGDAVCVTGTLGRSGAALRYFAAGDDATANDLFRFEPRIAAGRALAPHATAMMDSSDGLARSLHQLSEASNCGVAVESPLPIDGAVDAVADGEDDRRELGVFFGEDFELVCTIPETELPAAREAVDCGPTEIGVVVERDRGDEGDDAEPRITLDDEPLPDRGFTHSR